MANFSRAFTLMLMMIAGFILPTAAQSETTLSGWLTIVHGDPAPASGALPRQIISLSDGQGNRLAELVMDDATTELYNRQQVTVTGEPGVGAAGESVAPTLIVTGIQPLDGDIVGAQSDVSAQLTGSQAYINILCAFPDVAGTPHNYSWYQGILGSSYPGLDHYWREQSYNAINLNGSTTITQWFTLPRPLSYYLTANGAKTGELAQDCVSAADPTVNFAPYKGINSFLNGDLGGFAYGGSAAVLVDGSTRVLPYTWMSDWSDIGTLAHELGHSFGLPHSSGPAANPPTNGDVYVSAWDLMSQSWGYFMVNHPTYSWVPPGTIGYHLDKLNWIPADRKVSVNPNQSATVTLEQLRQPVSGSNALLVKIPIGGSSTRFYTVEARKSNGYDQNTPGAAVVIHHVDMNRAIAGHALVVDGDGNGDVNDAGAMWLVGETFTDAVNNIHIEVISSTLTSFTVGVSNNISPNAAPVLNYYRTGTPQLTWNTVSWATDYEIRVDDTNPFSEPALFTAVVPSSQLFATITPALGSGTYYMQVRARNVSGQWGNWSIPLPFVIGGVS